MFVAEGAKAEIAAERKQDFVRDFVQPLLAEARALGLEVGELSRLIEAEASGVDPNSAPTPSTETEITP